MINQQLFEAAKLAMDNAYAPYSNYKVGACILSKNNNKYSGCNVENISFPCGTCAEAGAISSMIANGDYKIKFILIMSSGSDLVYPCGACLQRIAEFSTNETTILLADTNKICKSYNIKELLPKNFSTKDLI